jgi:alkylated DNA repair dioxygenase AlkB
LHTLQSAKISLNQRYLRLKIIKMLFSNFETFDLPDAYILFHPQFYPLQYADAFLTDLTEKIAWQQGEITMFGKKVLEPRLSAWYGDAGKTYTYSGKKQEPLAWNEPLQHIKTDIENLSNLLLTHNLPSTTYNSVLCNFYRNGQDSMGFHADNEPELGKNPIIASVNFGESRRFIFRRRDTPSVKHEILLTHGSLLIMAGAMQHHWVHAVPKEPKKTQPRINLTFRFIN